MESRVINPWTWQDRFGFVQAKEVSGAERTLYRAGQTSVDEQGQPLHEGQIEAQAMQALDNLETVLGEAGFALADITRLDIYATDVDAYREAAPAVGARLARPASARRRHFWAWEAGRDRSDGGEVSAHTDRRRRVAAYGFAVWRTERTTTRTTRVTSAS